MADPQKIVQVPDVGIVAFPGNMPDSHVASIIKTHLSNLLPQRISPLTLTVKVCTE